MFTTIRSAAEGGFRMRRVVVSLVASFVIAPVGAAERSLSFQEREATYGSLAQDAGMAACP